MEKPQLVLLVFGLLAAEWPPAAALPNGAPLGACGSMAPQHNNISPQPGPNPHSIQTQNLKPNVQVHLDGPFYKGILLEARYPNGTTAVGTWQTAPADTKTIRCFDRADSAVTHSNTNDKSNTTVYTWVPPPTSVNCTEKAVVFLATVAQSRAVYWLNLRSETIYVGCSGSLMSLSGFAVVAMSMVAGLAAF
ncbi:putative defense protein isoform X1 [Scyliorhinus canicula]|uniref:putative defense protein isoform X1 n=1 Tax=Scyliorhinus canicula TaxID=7830 RepID=UPI0018F6CA83|nr:putative defense protein isoform X1 [Scyliorhinus canicula]